MNATFYTVSKRRNSTKQGTGGSQYTVTLKDSCSVLAPRLALQWSGTGTPRAYNQCYIGDFGRYYWVDDWTYQDRQWVASCRVDVLATAKTEIGASSKYVLRAASDYDPDILDSKYPAKMSYKSAETIVANPYGGNMNNGVYIVSISGQGISGVDYLQMDATNFRTMIADTYTNSQQTWNNLTSNSVEEAIKNYGIATYITAANPFQYINSVMWFPKPFSSVPYGSVILGPILTGASATKPSLPTGEITLTFSMPTITTTEEWQKSDPYRTYTIFIPPFGEVTLDPTLCCKMSSISASIVYDYISGGGTCTFYGTQSGDTGVVRLGKVSGQIGIPVATASRSIDNLGANTQASLQIASGASNGIFSLFSGNLGGVFSNAAQIAGAIESSARANAGSVQQKGVGGGIGYLYHSCWLHITQYDTPEMSPAEFGKPLMKIKQISSLSGYVLCADGEVDAPLTSGELSQLESFLLGGFFYE